MRTRYPAKKKGITLYPSTKFHKLGKEEAPKITQEFENIYRAIRAVDPAGGGIADEIVALDESGTMQTPPRAAGTIQKALNKVPKHGGYVHVKSGEYTIDRPIEIPPGVKLRGSVGGTVFNVTCQDGIINKGSCQDIEIRDLTLRGSQGAVSGVNLSAQVAEGEDLFELAWTRPDSQSQTSQRYVSYPFSYARCSNGKIIVVYSPNYHATNSYLYEGFADNLDSFLRGHDTIRDRRMIFTGTGYTRGTVFNFEGGLYLAVVWLDHDAEAETAEECDSTQHVRIYKSPSGTGGDWVLHGTIRDSEENDHDVIYHQARRLPVGAPLVTSTGRWVISYPHFVRHGTSWQGYLGTGAGFATSDDAGVTWTTRYTWRTNLTGQCQGLSRSMEEYGGRIWGHIFHTYSNGGTHIFSSPDNGASWVHMYRFPEHPFWSEQGISMGGYMDASFYREGAYLYMVTSHSSSAAHTNAGMAGPDYIWRSNNPTQLDSWEWVWNGGVSSGTGHSRGPDDVFARFFADEGRMVLSITHFVNGEMYVDEGAGVNPKVEGVRASGFTNGVKLEGVGGFIAQGNYLFENEVGLRLEGANRGIVGNNIIGQNERGILLDSDTYYNIISGNNLMGNEEAIDNSGTMNNIIGNQP